MGLMRVAKLWPQRTIPFTVSNTVPAPVRPNIESAVAEWNNNTVINFASVSDLLANPKWVQRHPNPAFPRIRFVMSVYAVRCSSFGGMKGGEQHLRCLANWDVPILVHELGHAIGLYHEHQRLDRDDFVLVNPYLVNGYKRNFGKKGPPWAMAMPGGAYDCSSVMHYPDAPPGFQRKPGGACTAIGPKKHTGKDGETWLSPSDRATADFFYGKKPLY